MVPKALLKAITMHRVHMQKPSTATTASQKKLMDLLEDTKDELQKHMKAMSKMAMEHDD